MRRALAALLSAIAMTAPAAAAELTPEAVQLLLRRQTEAEHSLRARAAPACGVGSEPFTLGRDPRVRDFCADAHAFACGGRDAQTERDNAQIASAKLEARTIDELSGIRPPARRDALSALDRVIAYQSANKTVKKPAAAKRAMENFEKRIHSEIRWDPKSAGRLLETLRTALIGAIGQDPAIPPAKKKALQDSIRKVRLASLSEYIAPGTLPFLNEATETCGNLGQTSNAAFNPYTATVVICPGLLIQHWELARHDRERFEASLMSTLLHEIAHRIDANAEKPLYGKLLDCYRKEYGALISMQPPGAAREKTVLGKLGEASADEWAARGLAHFLRSKPPAQRVRLLTAIQLDWGDYCDGGMEADDPHPSDSFRLGVVYGRNPELRGALGCTPPTNDYPACTTQGRVPR